MELTQIRFKKDNIELEMEKNTDGSYSVSISKIKDPEEAYEKPFCDFRTNEIDIDELIDILTFSKNYKFIQK